ncbi:Signal transduction histidine kinase, core [Moorella glycerini]|uniref:histidine kinase n=1 Tax=Neomoorella stamsii TaxID=1266720 RepID=A0A9X7J3M7_9FIRM|nr:MULTISPECIES: GAF domain-containing sensor histidine kinase [Moorella]PRR74351.1 Sporulation kinase A [Moorella stamsii]CEP66758.1 Signal transduction histidine kinase, core [Moorella glycerini]
MVGNDIQMQRLLEKKIQQLSFLVKLNNLVGYLPLELDTILKTATREIDKLLPRCKSFLFLFDQGCTRMQIQAGRRRASSSGCHRVDDVSHCRIASEGFPLIVQDVNLSPGCPNRLLARNTRAYVCIPIMFGKEFLGSLTVESPKINSFSRDNLELLVAVASQLSIAIYRARLYQQLNKEKEELARANREIKRLNIHLQKKLKELKEAEARLIQSEKLAATGRMAANLAHEINNPISIILSSLDYLLMDPAENNLSAELVAELEAIAKHARRIAGLVRDLLIFAREPVQELAPLDLNEVINKTLVLPGSRPVKDGISLCPQLAETQVVINGNQMKLQQLLLNLIDNAADAMPAGGQITIKTAVDVNNGMAILAVKDEGIGIKPEDLGKIFDPFFTTKEPGKGTGLGLSIVYNIVKEHGGMVEVESKPGTGTTFTLKFPLCQAMSKDEF